jgi:hypothetical protein
MKLATLRILENTLRCADSDGVCGNWAASIASGFPARAQDVLRREAYRHVTGEEVGHVDAEARAFRHLVREELWVRQLFEMGAGAMGRK